MVMAGESLQLPLFIGWESEKLGMLVPFLFITVACGACSGFHSIVASGTTSKQIRRESDARRVTHYPCSGGCAGCICPCLRGNFECRRS